MFPEFYNPRIQNISDTTAQKALFLKSCHIYNKHSFKFIAQLVRKSEKCLGNENSEQHKGQSALSINTELWISKASRRTGDKVLVPPSKVLELRPPNLNWDPWKVGSAWILTGGWSGMDLEKFLVTRNRLMGLGFDCVLSVWSKKLQVKIINFKCSLAGNTTSREANIISSLEGQLTNKELILSVCQVLLKGTYFNISETVTCFKSDRMSSLILIYSHFT